jgi:hypothetical protein
LAGWQSTYGTLELPWTNYLNRFNTNTPVIGREGRTPHEHAHAYNIIGGDN